MTFLPRIVFTLLILNIKVPWFQILPNTLEHLWNHVRQTQKCWVTVESSIKNRIDDITSQTRINIESSEDQSLVEPNTNPTEKTQSSPLQIPESFYSEILHETSTISICSIATTILWCFSIRENWRWKWTFKTATSKKIERANHLLRKQELERSHMIKQLNQPDPKIQDDSIILEKMLPSTSKRVPPQHVAR